jgi:hypothetical protein
MHAIRLRGSEPILAIFGGPFRANSGEGISQGKPWAMLYWPLRATDWKRPKLQATSVRLPPLFFQPECGVVGNVIGIDENAVDGLLFVLAGFAVFNVLIRLIDG